MFFALIKEFTGNTFLSKHKGMVYFENKHVLYDKDANELLDLYIDDEDTYSTLVCNEGIWLRDYYKDKSFLYSVEKKKIISEVPYFMSSDDKVIGGYRYRIKTREEEGLEKYNDKNQLIKKIKNLTGFFSNSDKLIFIRPGLCEGSIFAYDFDLSLAWEVRSEKECFSTSLAPVSEPYYFPEKNLLIVNLGEDSAPPRGNFEINAYNADTGKLVWQEIVATSPDISKLYGDKIYAVVRESIIIFEAATGEILHKVNHGLFVPSNETLTRAFVYPYSSNDQDYLLVTSAYHHCVQLRTADAQHILQTIKVPMPFTTSHQEPVCCDGKVYIGLVNADSGGNMIRGAVLVLTELGDEAAPEYVEAEIEARPPILVTLETNEDGELVYVVSIAHNNLSDVIRYGTIALKETAYKYGGFRGSSERNKKHKGLLCLKVKAQPLGMEKEVLLEALSVIKRRVESSLNLMPKKAGDKKSDFSVSIVVE